MPGAVPVGIAAHVKIVLKLMAMRVATRWLDLGRESSKAVAYEELTRGRAACGVGCKWVQSWGWLLQWSRAGGCFVGWCTQL